MKTDVQDKPAGVADAPAESSTALQPAPAATSLPASRVPVKMGLAPTSIEEGWRLAQILAQSELVPKNFRQKPADVLVALEMGIEIGFPPMQALQSIAVINGRPSVWGDGFIALIMASPLYRDHDEYYEVAGERRDGLSAEDLKRDDTAAVCTFWRQGKPNPVTRRFTIAQAKKASLLGKEGPWQTYPDRMLLMRARSWAGRDTFPDLLRGIRTAEEAMDEREPIDVEPTPAPVQPRRASQAPAFPPNREIRDGQLAATPIADTPATETRSDAPAAESHAPAAAQQIRGLKVTRTGFVRPRAGEPYYEIRMQTTTGQERVFLTREEQVYREAASFEGTDHLVVATYHEAKKEDAKVLALDAIAIYEGPVENGGGLFS